MKSFLREYQTKSMRYYTHFDVRSKLNKYKSFLLNDAEISRHPFFPFIKATQTVNKFYKGEQKPPKKRDIMYCAHVDRYIYQYYNYKLNIMYNENEQVKKMNESVIAYRTNMGKNNIHFAKEVFDFIESNNDEKMVIIVGDFTSFFDNLKHDVLLKKIKKIMRVEYLPKDWYAVIKSLMKYSYVEIGKLINLNTFANEELNIDYYLASESKKKKMIKEFNKLTRAIEMKEWNNLRKKKGIINRNKNDFGIPQGSPMSALLSNIYMIDFDLELYEYTQTKKGLYRRYSDDFIIILPFAHLDEVCEIIEKQKEENGLELEKQKTKIIYSYNKHLFFEDENRNEKATSLDYLGFTYDGRNVRIRDKTTTKYYYRMYRKIKTIKAHTNGSAPEKKSWNKGIAMMDLYQKFSEKGAKTGKILLKGKKIEKRGNYLTYVSRAKNIFSDRSLIHHTSHHYEKIRKKLKKNKFDS